MAFWAQASSAGGVKSSSRAPAAVGPARPLTYILSTGPHSLTEFASLVRLRVDVPTAAAALEAALLADGDDDDDEAGAAQREQDAACAIGQLHQVIRGIELATEDARVSSVLELMPDRSLQLLCSKAVCARLYKALLPHQAAVGFVMAPAKHCLSQKPVAAWDLQESLQTAVVKTLTSSSSGTPACTTTTTANTTAPAAAQQQWMCLSRRKLMGSNMLAAPPGQASTTPFVELEVQTDAASKGLLLIIHAAGSTKFRLFSPMQALQQDAKALAAPLAMTDTDAELLADPVKRAAAARQLDGRAVKLLPDERLVFIKGMTAAPTDAAQLQCMSQWWLGSYGLLLPPSFPFLVGVASHPEAEAAQMLVPSCCVLTNLGLSTLPGSTAGGSCHTAAVSRLVSDLQAAAAGYSFWGHKLSVQLRADSTQHAGAGLTQATLQITQGSLPAGHGAQAGTAAAAAASQLKTYRLQTQWTSAAQLSELQLQAQEQAQAAAATQPQQPQQQLMTAAGVQLMGLVEADGTHFADGDAAQADDSREQHQQHGRHGSSIADTARWQGLKTYLQGRAAEKQQQDQKQRPPPGGLSTAPAAAASSGGGLLRPAGAAAAAQAAARGVASVGPPAAPMLGGRKPAASKPAAAAKKPVAAAASRISAGGQLAASLAAAAVAVAGTAATAGTARPKAPALGKRPGAADAAGKPPAAKKAKAAAAAGGTAKPKAPKTAAAKQAAAKPAAAGAAAASGPTAAAAGDALAEQQPQLEGAAPPQLPAAAATAGAGASAGAGADVQQEQQQRKRTKASDLDAAAVAAKVLAAFAASGGAALKGVSVPEMQCYLRAQGQKGGSAKRADVEARLLALLSAGAQGGGA